MWTVLRQLPPRVRVVMVLRYFEDLSESDIARTLGCSTGTVKSQHSRGLKKLRTLLAARGIHTDAPEPSGVPEPQPSTGPASVLAPRSAR